MIVPVLADPVRVFPAEPLMISGGYGIAVEPGNQRQVILRDRPECKITDHGR
jgi:hypothetical protein